MDSETKNGMWITVFVIIVVAVLVALPMLIVPKYRVWSKELKGKATLKEAEWDRQIRIKEAEANLGAEKLNAKAEVERAKGMAEAMEIENGQLTATYNQYLFIRTLEELAKGGDQPMIIYLPSEGMLPVMDLKQ